MAGVPILYPLKTPENQRFFGVFREFKMGKLNRNGLNYKIPCNNCFSIVFGCD